MPKQRPTIKMTPSSSRRRGGGSLEEPTGKRHAPLPPGSPNQSKKVRGVEPPERERTPTESGQALANLMGSIVKESTTGKRYTGNVSQRAWDDHGKARAAHTRKTGDIPSDKQVPPPKGEFKYVEKGTHGQNWDLIRLGMDAREQERKKQERSNGSRGHFDSGHT